MSVKFYTVSQKVMLPYPVFRAPDFSLLRNFMERRTSNLQIARTLSIYWSFLKNYQRDVAFCLIVLPAILLIQNGLLPMVYSRIIDRLHLIGGNIPNFYLWLLGFLALHISLFVGQRLVARFWSRLEHRTIKDIELHIFDRLLGQSNHFHASRHAGELVAQAKRFTGSLSGLMSAFYYNMYSVALRIAIASAVLLFVAPFISLVLIVWTAIYVVSIFWLTKRKMHASEAAAYADSRMTARLADTIGNASAVKMFGSESLEGRAYEKLSQDKYQKRRRDWWLSEVIFAWQGILMILLEAVVLALSVKLVQDGVFTIGKLALVQFFLAPILVGLWGIADIFRRVETSLSDASEMTLTLGMEPAVRDPKNPQAVRMEKGAIRFDQVSFHYGSGWSRRALFHEFNLNIPAGQKVGLVGPSGSGKTSLTKLLLRFMDLDKGKIMIDGQSISDIRQNELRRRIAFVPQEPQLFHRTILENIRYSRPGASDEEVIAAAKKARAHGFIDKLPRGYDTLVGERGSKLSGGERQRVAIARAMLKDAPIVILDEATSALDTESELLIQRAFEDLLQERTAIVIAHRLSTIQKMDRIVVLKDGGIAEDGSHDELLDQLGLYAELWSYQSGGLSE